LCGSISRSSLASWAASVLFGAITRVGRCTCSTSHAVVADLPVPVAPRSTTSFSPRPSRSVSSAIAAGWSPAGSNSLTTWKGASVRRMSPTGRNSEWATTGCSDAKAMCSRVVRAPRSGPSPAQLFDLPGHGLLEAGVADPAGLDLRTDPVVHLRGRTGRARARHQIVDPVVEAAGAVQIPHRLQFGADGG